MKVSERLRLKTQLSTLVKNYNRQLKINKIPDSERYSSTIILANIRKFNTKLAPFKIYPQITSANEIIDTQVLFSYVNSRYMHHYTYIDANYIDMITSQYKGEEVDTIFAQQVMNKVVSMEFKTTFRDYVENVFTELLEVLEENGMDLGDVNKYEYTQKIQKNPHWSLLDYNVARRGGDILKYSSKTFMIYTALLYSFYIANRDLVDGLLPTVFDYKTKFKSFLHSFNMVCNKLNKSENLNIIHDMLGIDDPIFYGVLNVGLTNLNNKKEDKTAMDKFGGILREGMYRVASDASSVFSFEEYEIDQNKRLNSDSTKVDVMYSDKKDSLIAESCNATKLSRLFIASGINGGMKLFSELLNIRISRTDAEKINYLARKVDRCLILFENMSNVWNKMDAMDFAYDILNEIDEIYIKSTDKNFLLALDSIRKTLTDGMVDCRKKDIKKLRTTINIVYPQGYEG